MSAGVSKKDGRAFMKRVEDALEALGVDPDEAIRRTTTGHFLVTVPGGSTVMVPSKFGPQASREYQRRCKNAGLVL